MCRGRGDRVRKSRVGDHQRRRGTEFEPIGFFKIIQGFFIHEEQGIGKLLDSRLEAVGGRRGVEVAIHRAVLEKNSVSTLGPKNKARLIDFGKNQNSQRLFPDRLSARIGAVKMPESGFRLLLQNLRRFRQRGSGQRDQSKHGDENFVHSSVKPNHLPCVKLVRVPWAQGSRTFAELFRSDSG